MPKKVFCSRVRSGIVCNTSRNAKASLGKPKAFNRKKITKGPSAYKGRFKTGGKQKRPGSGPPSKPKPKPKAKPKLQFTLKAKIPKMKKVKAPKPVMAKRPKGVVGMVKQPQKKPAGGGSKETLPTYTAYRKANPEWVKKRVEYLVRFHKATDPSTTVKEMNSMVGEYYMAFRKQKGITTLKELLVGLDRVIGQRSSSKEEYIKELEGKE